MFARCGECPGKKGGERTGPNPTDRGRPGSRRHILVDAGGIPLAVALTPANVHDSRRLKPVLDAVTPIHQCWGRPRRRPGKLHADKAYDFPRCRRACHERRIVPRIARRGLDTSERLVVRYEQRANIFEAFHHLATAIICCRFVKRWFC